MRNINRIPATDVTIGDEIAAPDGTSLVVEKIARDGQIIDFAGTRNVFSFLGVEGHPGGVHSALFDDTLSVIAK